MATRGRPTQQKRQRERARQEQRKTKEARRRDAKERRAAAPPATGSGDPDLDGIVAGPQPLSEWQVEGLAEFEPADDDAEETAGGGGAADA